MATNFLNDDIYYQQREDPFELFNNRRIVAPDTKRKETNHRNLIELEKDDDDVMIIDDDIKEDRALPKSNPKTETNKEATTTKTPATTTTTTTASLDEDEKMARKMQEEYDRELAEEFNRRENRIRAFNRPNASSSSSRFNRNYADLPLLPVPINEDSEDNSVLVDMSRPINSYNRSSLREHATQFRRAEPTAPIATNSSSSTSRIGASTITPNNATNSMSRIPPSIQDDLMNSIARSSNQSNNQINSNNNGVATTSNDASRRGYQPFDRNSAMMTGARRSGSANHSSAMAATASWISSLPSHNPNTNADPVNNLASAFSILNDDEIVSGFMGDMRLQQPDHSNHRISQFQPNNHQHHNHQMPANLHRSLQRRQRFTNNLNRAEFMPHSRAPASSIALRVAMNNRDFTPDDYETLLRLDEINQVKKVLSKEEIESLPCFSYKQSDAAAAASGAGSDKSCSICYEDYVSREKIMALACTHKFHKKCIQKWLQESRRCPLCQKDAVSGE